MGSTFSKKDTNSSNTSSSASAAPNNYDEKRRTQIATEVVETERSYVNNLRLMVKIYLDPLKASAEKDKNPILPANDVKNIFGIIEVLVNFHGELLLELEERMKKWGPQYCVGDIFEKNNHFFKMISTYVNGYNKSLETYTIARQKNKSFDKFLQKCMENPEAKLDLQSYLIMPVQRLPRYVLLLTELVKYSNPKHQNFPALRGSLEAVRKVADFVNEAKKDAESAQKMLSIQENIIGKRARTILEPTRKFFSEGPLTWFNSSTKAPRPLQYFLFNDSIMLASPEVQGFFNSTLKWNLKVLVPFVSAEINESPDSDRFDIVTPTKTFNVELEKGVDRDDWIEVFYWLRSGCGPRAEKISSEAQKRQFRKSETVEHLRPQKKDKNKEPKAENATLPRKLPSDLDSSKTNGTSSPRGEGKKDDKKDEKGKSPEPPKKEEKGNNNVKSPAPAEERKDEKGKVVESPRKDEKGKAPEAAKKDEKGKSPAEVVKKEEKGKSPEVVKKEEKGKSPEAVKKEEKGKVLEKGKSGEIEKDKTEKPKVPEKAKVLEKGKSGEIQPDKAKANDKKPAANAPKPKPAAPATTPPPAEENRFLRSVSSLFSKTPEKPAAAAKPPAANSKTAPAKK